MDDEPTRGAFPIHSGTGGPLIDPREAEAATPGAAPNPYHVLQPHIASQAALCQRIHPALSHSEWEAMVNRAAGHLPPHAKPGNGPGGANEQRRGGETVESIIEDVAARIGPNFDGALPGAALTAEALAEAWRVHMHEDSHDKEWGACWPSHAPLIAARLPATPPADPEALNAGTLERACIAVMGPWFDESHERGRFAPMELAQRIIREYRRLAAYSEDATDG